MTRITQALAAAGLLAILLSAGCSPAAGNGEATVFTVVTGFSQGGPATTADTVDIGVPGSRNLTSYSVRLLGVSLVSVAPSVYLTSVFAYPPGPGVGVMFGNLVQKCRQSYRPYPVSADVTPPHAVARWNAVLAITFTRPGRYDLHRVKIYYVRNGHRGWQYQNLNTTMTITTARKGVRPAFGGCL